TAGFNSEEVTLVRNNNGAGVRGVFYCDSPWLCPTCAPRRAAERAEKVQTVFSATEKKKGRITFVTLTVGHTKNHSLSELKQAVTSAGSLARKGKPWKLAQDRYGIVGTLVSPEVTYSIKHGWHYHLHLALIVLNDDDEKAHEAGEWLIGRYMNYINKMGFKTSRKAQDVTVVWRQEDLAQYMAKGSAAWEVASAGATKDAARGSLSPWDLAALAGKGDSESANLFLEYADVMPGTKSCVITKKIADILEISADEEEPEGHTEEVENDDEIVGVMQPSRWHRILRNGYAADVLKVTSAGWKWGDIDNLISRMLNEGEANYHTSKEKVEIVKEHKLSDDEFIDKVRLAYYRLTGGKKTYGRAVQVALDEERSYAVKYDKVFILPDLKNVMSVLGD
ncbi:protein rep, partial [Brucella pseudogrignonensis]